MFMVQQHFQENIHAPITLDEMWNTIISIRATTPGPDGISNLYIKNLWHILGPIILDAWNYSIETNNLPPSHKTSLLRLIPGRTYAFRIMSPILQTNLVSGPPQRFQLTFRKAQIDSSILLLSTSAGENTVPRGGQVNHCSRRW